MDGGACGLDESEVGSLFGNVLLSERNCGCDEVCGVGSSDPGANWKSKSSSPPEVPDDMVESRAAIIAAPAKRGRDCCCCGWEAGVEELAPAVLVRTAPSLRAAMSYVLGSGGGVSSLDRSVPNMLEPFDCLFIEDGVKTTESGEREEDVGRGAGRDEGEARKDRVGIRRE